MTQEFEIDGVSSTRSRHIMLDVRRMTIAYYSDAEVGRSSSARHSTPKLSARVPKNHRVRSAPEVLDGPCCWNKYSSGSDHSTDSQFTIQKIFQSWFCDSVWLDGHGQSNMIWEVWAATPQFLPSIHLGFDICSSFYVSPSLRLSKAAVVFEHLGYSETIRIDSKDGPPTLAGYSPEGSMKLWAG